MVCRHLDSGLVAVLAGILVATTLLTAAETVPGNGTEASATAGVGDRLAPWLVKQLVREISNGLKQRGINDRFTAFQSYAGEFLDRTAGRTGNSEVTGMCRLGWYDHLLRHPLEAPVEAEQFTRELHQALRDEQAALARTIAMAREKMDAGHHGVGEVPRVTTPEQSLEVLKQALAQSQAAFAAAIAPLSPSEITRLRPQLYSILTEQGSIGHTLWHRGTGRLLCDQLEKMNRSALFDAADALAPLNDPQFLVALADVSGRGDRQIDGVRGAVLDVIDTATGQIIIGSPDDNTYQLNQLTGVCAVIDLGGRDVYREGTVSLQRPLLVVIDLAGDDRYEGTQPGIQGGAILGVSLVIDQCGDDVYDARDVAQGSAIGGVGILIDGAGNDSYRGLRRVQGQALAGLGVLLDRAGKDQYRAAMWGQGFGGPLGFGVLDDLGGDDHYYCGGKWRTSYYPKTPGYEGWGQGIGAGLRGVACGGIGVILEGAGDDLYEYDYFGQGGGYWLGVGFARDFGGNDRRLGGTQKTYDGGARDQMLYGRFTCGFGCHYALGFCFDDEGNDTYGGTIMGLGCAWDCSNGCLCDFNGNDRYEASGGLTQGDGAQAGLGTLLDYRGDDTYLGHHQGYAASDISYHAFPQCGGNFSFLIDYGGSDTYGCSIGNNSYTRRGSEGGFLIDRPFRQELEGRDNHATK